jgi:o-succinylbenzoate---CoA ligase
VRDLIAFELAAGPAFVDALRSAWDAGDAVLPLDARAPRAHIDAVLASMRPAAIVDAHGERHALAGGVPVEDGDALVVTTSGTTGVPKGAVHTHRSVEYAGFSTSIAAGVLADTRWLACLPLSHVGGLSVVTRALVTGAELVIHDGVDAAAIDQAAHDGATHVSLVPTALRRIDPGPWHTILLGGSSIPVDRPSNSIATYGMTETFGGVVYDGLALNGVEVRIGGADEQSRVGPIAVHDARVP